MKSDPKLINNVIIVLMNVFKYLDDMSLWTVGQVCQRWRGILNMHIRPERWRHFTLLRWPLLQPVPGEQDWYGVSNSKSFKFF